jgi:hypothetical protein
VCAYIYTSTYPFRGRVCVYIQIKTQCPYFLCRTHVYVSTYIYIFIYIYISISLVIIIN